MPYSSVYTAILINLLAQILPAIGVTAGTEQITSAVQLIVAIGTGLWIMYQRTLMKKVGKEQSDVNLAGVKK